ncbi:MAG: EAL domain-containing protein [Lachnospiraceae bacterium]|nr:EAL domain-containing protein [Lachnospiraceae bacterium]
MNDLIENARHREMKAVFIDSLTEGFTLLIPLIFISVLCTLLMNFPFQPYQEFLYSESAGVYHDVLFAIYEAIWGNLSVYIVVAVSWSFAVHTGMDFYERVILIFVSMFTLLFLVGFGTDSFERVYISQQGMFSAFFSLLLSCNLYRFVNERLSKRFKSYRISRSLSASFRSTGAIVSVLAAAVFIETVVNYASGGKIFQQVACDIITQGIIYAHSVSPLSAALFYELICMGLWFFGIHGQNFLYVINDGFYMDLLWDNINNGGENIINTVFLNTYCILGGSGCILALIVAILIRSRNLSSRTVAKLGILPGIFNMSEVLTFGLPIVFEPVLLIPFVATPIVNCFLSYFMTVVGFLPIIDQNVTWTMPMLLSGYMATGTVMGPIWQLILLAIDVAVYLPFVARADYRNAYRLMTYTNELINILKESEEEVREVTLMDLPGRLGETAKDLAFDLKNDLEENKLFLAFQPQYDRNDQYMGAEALIRWQHETVGLVYPPLVIKLATENGFLHELEMFIFDATCKSIKEIEDYGEIPAKISANITGMSPLDPKFVDMIDEAVEKYGIDGNNLWIELTEQAVMNSNPAAMQRLSAVRRHGHKLLIDDFGMGHTSIDYLKSDMFDGVKLDGKITRDVVHNKKDQHIISSVSSMCDSMNMVLIAEFVESEAQRDMLKRLGGDAFQGFYYSKPQPLSSMISYVKEEYLGKKGGNSAEV